MVLTMRRKLFIFLATALILAPARHVRADDTWSTPYHGVSHLHRRTANQNINALLIDLCAAGVSVRATAWDERGRTASSFGSLVGAQAATNGDFYNPSGYTTVGIAMHAGALWSGGVDDWRTTPVGFGAGRVEIHHQSADIGPEPWMQEIVSGQTLLVWDGAVAAGPGGSRDPRTAVGLSADHRTLILVVVDGRQGSMIGMTFEELAGLLIELGARTGVNLDGGGSSTMWLQHAGVVNHPSDGGERTVANHLAIYASGSGPAPHCPGGGTLDQANGNESIALANWPDDGAWPNDGHPEVFAVTPAGAMVHLYPHGHADDWCEPLALDDGAACGFAAGFWPSPKNYPEVFTPTPAGSTAHLWLRSGEWTSFEDYGGSGLEHLSTVTWTDGRVEAFALGSGGAIRHNWWMGDDLLWSGWESLEGSFVTGVSAISWQDGHVELFTMDAAGHAWHNWSGDYPTGWHGWEMLEGEIASRPMPVRWPDGHVEVFARGRDGLLQHSWHTGTDWNAFVAEIAGTAIEGEPSVAMNPDGAGSPAGPEVVARGSDGKVLHLWWDGDAYRPFEQLGDQDAASDPFVWKRADGTMEVFVINPAAGLRHVRRDADKNWGAWSTLGEGFNACAAAEPEPEVEPDGGTDAAADTVTDVSGEGDTIEDMPSADDVGEDASMEDATGDLEGEDEGESGTGITGGCGCSMIASWDNIRQGEALHG